MHLNTSTLPLGNDVIKHAISIPTLHENLIDKLLTPTNLASAWKRVKANKGSAGIDGMTIDDFPAFANVNWENIKAQIIQGTYHPSAVLWVNIPKPDGGSRALGIPTVLDRFIQQLTRTSIVICSLSALVLRLILHFNSRFVMTTARKQLVSLTDRAYLCGEDKTLGKSYAHRRAWVEDKLTSLSQVFAIDECAYAIMSNHSHMVLFIDEYSARKGLKRRQNLRCCEKLLA